MVLPRCAAIRSVADALTEVPVADEPREQAAQFVVSPIGGFLVWLALTPVSCAVSTSLVCPAGQKENFLGLTMFGLVGTLDTAGLAILGFVIAIVLYFVIGEWSKRQS
jgi:hypothetical protein